MKKLRLKRWVKVVLAILALIILAKFSADVRNTGIAECIKNGNTQAFCEHHLGD